MQIKRACGGAALPPSEEGGGCLHKGFEQADGGRDTPSMCENTLYRQWQKQMTAFSLGARLPLGANSALALSLPQSFVAAKRRQKPAPSSEGAEAAPPQGTDLALLSKLGINAITCRGYNPSVFSAFIVRGRQVCGRGTPGCPMAACCIRRGCRRLCPPQGRAGTLRRRRRRFR